MALPKWIGGYGKLVRLSPHQYRLHLRLELFIGKEVCHIVGMHLTQVYMQSCTLEITKIQSGYSNFRGLTTEYCCIKHAR